MTGDRSLVDKLVSPNGFDGRGPVPEKVTAAAKRIAGLRAKWLRGSRLTASEIADLLDAVAIQAEWMRELYEAVHSEGSEPQPSDPPPSASVPDDDPTRDGPDPAG